MSSSLAGLPQDCLAIVCEYLQAHEVLGTLPMTGNSSLRTNLKRCKILHWSITSRITREQAIFSSTSDFSSMRSVLIKWSDFRDITTLFPLYLLPRTLTTLDYRHMGLKTIWFREPLPSDKPSHDLLLASFGNLVPISVEDYFPHLLTLKMHLKDQDMDPSAAAKHYILSHLPRTLTHLVCNGLGDLDRSAWSLLPPNLTHLSVTGLGRLGMGLPPAGTFLRLRHLSIAPSWPSPTPSATTQFALPPELTSLCWLPNAAISDWGCVVYPRTLKSITILGPSATNTDLVRSPILCTMAGTSHDAPYAHHGLEKFITKTPLAVEAVPMFSTLWPQLTFLDFSLLAIPPYLFQSLPRQLLTLKVEYLPRHGVPASAHRSIPLTNLPHLNLLESPPVWIMQR